MFYTDKVWRFLPHDNYVPIPHKMDIPSSFSAVWYLLGIANNVLPRITGNVLIFEAYTDSLIRTKKC